jgi:uncharacterized protein (TIGR04551 family)
VAPNAGLAGPGPNLSALRNGALLLLALAALAARAEEKPAEPAAEEAPATSPAPAPTPLAPPPAKPVERSDRLKEEVRREVLDEVRRELDKTRQEIRDEVAYVESAEDARSYDARQLKELKQTVNLLQLHGYFRVRGDLFNRADLGRGADASGQALFPTASGTDYLGAGNMRLRLNPVLRISDDIALYAQLDVLDNVLLGANSLLEPYFDATTGAQLLSSRTAGDAISVKRLWAEIETPVGQLAFGRKALHWGEGMLYNDGNCFDCDYGTTFDRLQLSAGPFLRHVVTLAVDSVSEGPSSANVPAVGLYGNYGVPVDLQTDDDAWRLSVAVTRNLPPAELRRQLDDGRVVVNYGALFAYRFQETASAEASQIPPGAITGNAVNVGAHLFELDLYAQLHYRKFRLSTEWAGLKGSYDNILAGPNQLRQSLDLLQGAGVVRSQLALLKQDAMLVGLDFGIASGDTAPGMGARPGRPGSAADGSAGKGDIDGRQFCTTSACGDRSVTNFRMNPDFRIDQLLWRNLFTTVTDAWFLRGEVRFKPGGRASGGADDDGFDISGALVYSQAVFSSSTPGGASPLGIELDAAITYTSKDRFYAGLVGGFLLPLDGLNNPLLTGDDGTAKLGQVYRGIVGVTF